MIIKPKPRIGFDSFRKKPDTWNNRFKIYPIIKDDQYELYYAARDESWIKRIAIVRGTVWIKDIEYPLRYWQLRELAKDLLPLVKQAARLIQDIDWSLYEPINK